MGGVAGFLGTLRWQAVGDATPLEATLAQIGFFCLIIVAMFEVDVSSLVFLEEKLIITCWLLEKLQIEKCLPFQLSQYSPELLELIRSSPALHRLYEEDDGKLTIQPVFLNFKFSMHVVGATGFAVFITASIILNDLNEEKVAWITGSSFVAFASVGYLTGSYVPVFSIFKGWILLWNPFVREPEFLIKLQEVCLFSSSLSHSLPLSGGQYLQQEASQAILNLSHSQTPSHCFFTAAIQKKEIEVFLFQLQLLFLANSFVSRDPGECQTIICFKLFNCSCFSIPQTLSPRLVSCHHDD
jgi:hypothetical protein